MIKEIEDKKREIIDKFCRLFCCWDCTGERITHEQRDKCYCKQSNEIIQLLDQYRDAIVDGCPCEKSTDLSISGKVFNLAVATTQAWKQKAKGGK